MVHQWGFFGSISAIRKIWSLTANSRSLQAAALKNCTQVLLNMDFAKQIKPEQTLDSWYVGPGNKFVKILNLKSRVKCRQDKGAA